MVKASGCGPDDAGSIPVARPLAVGDRVYWTYPYLEVVYEGRIVEITHHTLDDSYFPIHIHFIIDGEEDDTKWCKPENFYHVEEIEEWIEAIGY